MRNHLQKIILVALLVLVTSVKCTCAQTDAHILGTGAWSKPVADDDHTLRGRLLVYDDDVRSKANHLRIYLEIQYLFLGAWELPLEIYYDPGSENHALQFELRDKRGRTIPKYQDYVDRGGSNIYGSWLTLLCDSTIRLRADAYSAGLYPKPKGMVINVEDGIWVIPPRHGPVYLSGTFTPPRSKRNRSEHNDWQGTLVLPKVKLTVPQR